MNGLLKNRQTPRSTLSLDLDVKIFSPHITNQSTSVSTATKWLIMNTKHYNKIPSHDMDILHTVAPPVFPSKVKKLAIGGSRAASVLRISWANIPPTMAHTGENSCAAVTATDLGERSHEVMDIIYIRSDSHSLD